MSFREKSAWITLLSLLILTILFALHIPRPYTLAPAPNGEMLHVLVRAIIVFMIVVTLAHVVVAALAPRDVKAAKDERERLIALKATAVSHYVYVFLSLGGIFVGLHLTDANAIGIGYLVLFGFIVAEIVNYALRIYFFRRGV